MAPHLQASLILLNAAHTREVVGVASMHHLCRNLLTHYCEANGVDPTALVTVLDNCVDSHLERRSIARRAYDAARGALQRAGRSAVTVTS